MAGLGMFCVVEVGNPESPDKLGKWAQASLLSSSCQPGISYLWVEYTKLVLAGDVAAALS